MLTDGLGNDSTLSLSTTAASIAGTLAVTGAATFDTNTLVVDAAANRVGVGLTAPKNPLHVNTSLQVGFVDASNDAMVFTWGGASTNGTIQTFSSSVLALNPAGNNVGIGTSAPLSTLQVGNTTINNAAIGSSLVRLLSRSTVNDVQEIGLGGEGSATISAIGNLVTDGSNYAKGAIYFATRDVTTNTAPTERMRITSAGNVGIGTTAPDSVLHVNNLVNTAYDPSNALTSGQTMRVSNLSTTSGISSNLLFVATGAGGGNGLGSISGVNTGTGSLAFTFATRDSGGSVTERMRITSTGNVGIGTDAPAQRLDISSGALITTRIDSDLTCNDTQGLIYTRSNNIGSIDGLRYASRSHRFVSHSNTVYATIDADGLKFGSDTAAANALDDYEEGTWTMGVAYNAASVGVTSSANTGT